MLLEKNEKDLYFFFPSWIFQEQGIIMEIRKAKKNKKNGGTVMT